MQWDWGVIGVQLLGHSRGGVGIGPLGLCRRWGPWGAARQWELACATGWGSLWGAGGYFGDKGVTLGQGCPGVHPQPGPFPRCPG